MLPVELNHKKQNPVVLLIIILGGLILLSLAKDLFFLLWAYSYEFELIDIYLSFPLNGDSWIPIYHAADTFITHPDQGIYQTVFFQEKMKFQYPPIGLLPFIAMIKLDFDYWSIVQYMSVISFISIIGITFCLYKIVIASYSKNMSTQGVISTKVKVILFVTIAAGTITFYPIMRGHHLGQIQIILDLLISFAFLTWVQDRKSMSGVLIALAALIKPQYALLLLWSLMRKEKDFTKGLMFIFVPAAIVSLGFFGFQEHLDYLSVLSYIGKHGEIYLANQSMNGVLNRLFSGINSSNWATNAFAPYNLKVYAGTLISTAFFIFIGLLFRPAWARAKAGSGSQSESLLDMAMMVIVATIASPVAWEHHYGVTWPIFMIAFISITDIILIRRDWVILSSLFLLCLSYLLVSNYFDVLEFDEKLYMAPWNLVQSYIYYGGLMLLIVVVVLRVLGKPKSLGSQAGNNAVGV
ncbi:MAG: DUF2029 domain-containing protein [Sneathiella sp.]|nr:DUF2029 domain-containing protein [Sneathiella sp.]